MGLEQAKVSSQHYKLSILPGVVACSTPAGRAPCQLLFWLFLLFAYPLAPASWPWTAAHLRWRNPQQPLCDLQGKKSDDATCNFLGHFAFSEGGECSNAIANLPDAVVLGCQHAGY